MTTGFSMIGELAFQHLCGDQTGCETVRCTHHLSEELRNFGDIKISSAMESMNGV
jgi:hypothetical protein